MCGIVGTAGRYDPALVRRMADRISHRGPDGAGFHDLPSAEISIGMRRLAVIDLKTGDQPLHGDQNRVHIVYNGEVYNYRELRTELEKLGHRFITTSDTEVVLHAYLAWGRDAWVRLHGMFAIAIVDERGSRTKLLLVRDRPGIKPLYFRRQGKSLLFASEIKALQADSGFSSEVDLAAIRSYLSLRYVPGPGSLLTSVEKLAAGHDLVWCEGDIEVRRWWFPPGADSVEAGLDIEAAADRFGTALRASVHRHMIADVPVGAFLSGGIDSNIIVALMAEVAAGPVKTFSIGFPDFPDHDRELAALTARRIGSDHHAIDCRAEDMASLPEIAFALDEPVGDAIVVPMYVLAREARKEVKVVLSGEGADEILGGYMFHRKLQQIARVKSFVPAHSFPVAARLASIMPVAILERLFDYPGALGKVGRRKIVSMLERMGDAPLTDLYRSAVSLFDADDIRAMAGGHALAGVADRSVGPVLKRLPGETALQSLVAMQYPDWLPDDILMKADKMTMAHSIEGRVPFMDELVIAAAAALPDATKLGASGNKLALRRFGVGLLPSEVLQAPKRAFYIPLEAYATTKPLADIFDWALDPVRVKKRGLFSPQWIAAQRAADPAQGFLPLKRLFSIVMLELWFERFAPSSSWT
ncbi:asparagine synthase (glutamine-hydrolyzing) [Bradyrhizobium sp. AUGA SZCCT0176]|uniref:asparagine synthase (glutamine-hydrolyzing) n=1 Tax=Bradyrhizobium sp. AUGA SZCCT0176 TaxID=2807664 RepID=UPI001BA7F310|nr:asparagine synthase (glutamine-hydrolyzing) [Bradyrhizobium sp. AUGA SZCCT0176]MBR1229201.1 asparagine synthase (glutamine-hydrolyzing) [Bradyrhizobium sp. AUGA SZCCT0176]